jgi:hypothetical protein
MGWFERLGARRRQNGLSRAPIVASRDLPPPALPRSPEPLPEEALVFARSAALRPTELDADPDGEAAQAPVPSIAAGADLRALLERVQQASSRREALDQAAQARARIVEQLSAGKAGAKPVLKLVESQQLPTAHATPSNAQAPIADLDEAFEDALASALETLRQLSELTKR